MSAAIPAHVTRFHSRDLAEHIRRLSELTGSIAQSRSALSFVAADDAAVSTLKQYESELIELASLLYDMKDTLVPAWWVASYKAPAEAIACKVPPL